MQKPRATMETPFGTVSLLIHRHDAVRVSTDIYDRKGGDERRVHELIVNRVQVTGYLYLERDEESGEFDLPRIKTKFPQQPGCYVSREWGWCNFKKANADWKNDEISSNASHKLYEGLTKAVNAFYAENKALFDEAEAIEMADKVRAQEREVARAEEAYRAEYEKLHHLQKEYRLLAAELNLPSSSPASAST